jgi:hypothetical protein
MRTILLFIFIVLCTIASATDYYISSSDGDDILNNGLSPSTPWETINKVNFCISTMNPGIGFFI